MTYWRSYSTETMPAILSRPSSHCSAFPPWLAHANLISDVARFLFSQSLIDETAVKEVVRMIDEADLDVFRGVLSGAAEVQPGKELEQCRPR
jgi:hypothetical protein